MFNIQKDLDIILITYNRKNELRKMIEFIFADNSPIKECNITFLDNHSTDGTSDLLRKLAQEKPNVKHICHKYNIGGNANIVRALETVDKSKKYFWILCDDDYIDWTSWNELEVILESGIYDVINIHTHSIIPVTITPEQQTAKFIIDSTFVPANIIKTSWITEDVLCNAYINIAYLFPHLALIINIINNKGKWISLPFQKNLIHMVKHHQNKIDVSYSRGYGANSKKHPYMEELDWSGAFCNSLGMLNDEHALVKRECVFQLRSFEGFTFEGYLKWQIPQMVAEKKYLNLISIYTAADDEQKDKLIEVIQYLSIQLEIYSKYIENSVGLMTEKGIKGCIRDVYRSVFSLILAFLKKILKLFKK